MLRATVLHDLGINGKVLLGFLISSRAFNASPPPPPNKKRVRYIENTVVSSGLLAAQPTCFRAVRVKGVQCRGFGVQGLGLGVTSDWGLRAC